METQEKTRTGSAQKRPAGTKKRPPEKARTAPGKTAAAKRTAPARKRPSAAGRTSAEKRGVKLKPQKDAAYKPHKKAENRRRDLRIRNAAAAISRFFSYENPILRRFSKQDLDVFGDGSTGAAKSARRRKHGSRINTPAVIYTEPRAFNRSRFAIQLLTVLAVVLALVLGMSVFFKVKVVTVSGNKVYSAWTVRENSGIVEGDNLLTFGRTRASGRIIANLPYVKSARIGIKLPDTVNIEIEEAAVVYAIQDESSVWWLINSNGKIVEQTSVSNSKNYTRVLGITLTDPQPGAQAVATEPIPTETNELGEYLPVVTTGAAQLNAALHILQALEDNDIVGSATSVDVTRIGDIILWYGTQYQVNLGSTERMDYKIACMNDAILQMSDYQTGILDISFNTMTDKVVYTPFG